MKNVVEFLASRSRLIYGALLIPAVVIGVILWALVLSPTGYLYDPSMLFALYLLDCVIWIGLAILDNRRLKWRLLLIWATELLPLSGLIYAIFDTNSADPGLSIIVSTAPVLGLGLVCVLASIAAAVVTERRIAAAAQ